MNSHIPYTDGYLIASLAHLPDEDLASVAAGFWRTITLPSGPTVLPEGMEECASLVYGPDLDLGTGWERTMESAGTVTFAGPQDVLPLEPLPELGGAYHRDIDETEWEYGAQWTVSATGGDVLPFDIEGPRVPADLVVTSPVAGFELVSPFSVAWVGGDATTTVTIRLNTAGNPEQLRGTIICEAYNDGHFAIPDALVDAMPPGYATVQVEHLHRDIRIAGNQQVRVEGVVTTLRIGVRQ